jgi:anaerobic selenocysteine-containing dehydrogenase
MGIVHSSRGRLMPASPLLRSEPRIVASLAKATLPDSTVDWDALTSNYDRIRDHIANVVPGFENFNARIKAASEGFYLPNSARERQWRTQNGKANFTVNQVSGLRLQTGQFLMMTIRSHDQYNTTIYGLDDRYRGIENERRVVFLNAADMEEHGVRSGDTVNLISHFQGEERIAPHFQVVPYDIPRHCAATYFPEANVLVPLDSVADESHTPTSKSVVITVQKVQASAPTP